MIYIYHRIGGGVKEKQKEKNPRHPTSPRQGADTKAGMNTIYHVYNRGGWRGGGKK